MKILHLSQTGLPDPRIERTALTMKKKGHEMVFLGGKPIQWLDLGAFEETHYLSLGNSLEQGLLSKDKKRWLKKIEELKPDLIHAHNVIVANFLLDTEYPAVYDDHEYWSKQIFKLKARGFIRRLATRPLAWKIPKWERQILERYPTITTNENTAKEHRERCKFVGVTRNVPCLREVEGLENPAGRQGIVYVGSDFELISFMPHRNMTGLRDIVDVTAVHGLTHREMMKKLTQFKIGTTPWLPHPWHPYSDANKNYEYLHAGLQVVVNNILKEAYPDDPYIFGFNDYSDIEAVIDSIPDRSPEEMITHAKKKWIWENQEYQILEAYRHT